MTTEITRQLPPCPLPDCEGGEHHCHDIDVYSISAEHDCAIGAAIGFRCFGPHRPGMSSTYGHLTGQLTLTIADNVIDLGYVQVPVTGFLDRGQLRLSANTQDVANTVRELFAQSSAPEAVMGDE